jgi:hypothetical protein
MKSFDNDELGRLSFDLEMLSSMSVEELSSLLEYSKQSAQSGGLPEGFPPEWAIASALNSAQAEPQVVPPQGTVIDNMLNSGGMTPPGMPPGVPPGMDGAMLPPMPGGMPTGFDPMGMQMPMDPMSMAQMSGQQQPQPEMSGMDFLNQLSGQIPGYADGGSVSAGPTSVNHRLHYDQDLYQQYVMAIAQKFGMSPDEVAAQGFGIEEMAVILEQPGPLEMPQGEGAQGLPSGFSQSIDRAKEGMRLAGGEFADQLSGISSDAYENVRDLGSSIFESRSMDSPTSGPMTGFRQIAGAVDGLPSMDFSALSPPSPEGKGIQGAIDASRRKGSLLAPDMPTDGLSTQGAMAAAQRKGLTQHMTPENFMGAAEYVGDLASGFPGAVTGALGSAADALRSFPGKVQEGFRGLRDDANVGLGQVGDAASRGIMDAAGSIADAASVAPSVIFDPQPDTSAGNGAAARVVEPPTSPRTRPGTSLLRPDMEIPTATGPQPMGNVADLRDPIAMQLASMAAAFANPEKTFSQQVADAALGASQAGYDADKYNRQTRLEDSEVDYRNRRNELAERMYSSEFLDDALKRDQALAQSRTVDAAIAAGVVEASDVDETELQSVITSQMFQEEMKNLGITSPEDMRTYAMRYLLERNRRQASYARDELGRVFGRGNEVGVMPGL